jgi:hypothetical protein
MPSSLPRWLFQSSARTRRERLARGLEHYRPIVTVAVKVFFYVGAARVDFRQFQAVRRPASINLHLLDAPRSQFVDFAAELVSGCPGWKNGANTERFELR